MVSAMSRRVLQQDDRVESDPFLVQSDATWIKVEADRNAWPAHGGQEVIDVAVEIDPGSGWIEVGRFGTTGGVRKGRNNEDLPLSSATFNRVITAGTLARAVVYAKRGNIDTAVRLTWG